MGHSESFPILLCKNIINCGAYSTYFVKWAKSLGLERRFERYGDGIVSTLLHLSAIAQTVRP